MREARIRSARKSRTGRLSSQGIHTGGQIVTALGEDAPNVVGLVYSAGFGLDEGESIGAVVTMIETAAVAVPVAT